MDKSLVKYLVLVWIVVAVFVIRPLVGMAGSVAKPISHMAGLIHLTADGGDQDPNMPDEGAE